MKTKLQNGIKPSGKKVDECKWCGRRFTSAGLQRHVATQCMTRLTELLRKGQMVIG